MGQDRKIRIITTGGNRFALFTELSLGPFGVSCVSIHENGVLWHGGSHSSGRKRNDAGSSTRVIASLPCSARMPIAVTPLMIHPSPSTATD